MTLSCAAPTTDGEKADDDGTAHTSRAVAQVRSSTRVPRKEEDSWTYTVYRTWVELDAVANALFLVLCGVFVSRVCAFVSRVGLGGSIVCAHVVD